MEETRQIPASLVVIGFGLAALAVSLVAILLLRSVSPPDPGTEFVPELLGTLIVSLLTLLSAGLPLALSRLRDAGLAATAWVGTGALAGVIGGIGLSLLMLATHIFGAPFDGLPYWIIGIFAVTTVMGIATGLLSRWIILSLLNRAT